MLRRGLFRYAAGLAAGAWAQPVSFPGESAATLRALAEVVLPASLGTAFLDRKTAAFVTWVNGYRPHAEMEHGYGFTRIQYKAAHPAPQYLKNLQALEAAAQANGGTSFALLDTRARKQIVESALGEAQVKALPQSPTGGHIVPDLMAFYFRSSEAADVCYEADIRRDDCRGLRGIDQQPRPLRKRGS
jgi:hypothetical protein